MKIKRVLGGLAVLGLGAGLIGGVYAAGLADFVAAPTDHTLSSPIIVIGSSAGNALEYPKDVVGAADIAAAMAGYATTTQTIPSGAATTGVTGGAMITSDLNKTYVGSSTTGKFTYVKGTLTKTDLPTLLETLTFTDLNATTISYAQQIVLGSQYVDFGKQGDVTEPDLYTQFGSSYTYNTTIIFMGGLDASAVDTTYKIKLFGNEYTFGSTHTNETLEFYTSTGAETVSLTGVGSKSTVTIEGTSYEFELKGWGHEDTTPGVFLKVNGVSTSPAEWREGSTYTLPGTTTKVYINDVSVISTGGQDKTVSCDLFVGTKKLKISNGAAVEKNDVALVNTLATISASGSKINTIKIQIAPDTDEYLFSGNTFTDPVWGSFKFALGDMTPSLTAASRDYILVAKEGTNKVKLTFKNKEGTQYATNVFTYDTSTNGWERTTDGTYDFHVRECNTSYPTTNITVGDYFVLTNAADQTSYILKYANCYPHATASSRYVEFRDISSGGAIYKIYYTTDPYIRIGSSNFKVANLTNNCAGSKEVAVDLNGNDVLTEASYVNIYTEGGAYIDLTNTTPDLIKITENPLFNITGSNGPTGIQMSITSTYSSSDYVGFTIDGTTAAQGGQVGSANKYQYITDYGTYLEKDTDVDTVKIYYPGDRPAYANVAIGTNPVFSTSGGGGGTYNEAVPIMNPVAKLDTQVSTTGLTADLILVGGPCANTLVKQLLNTEWSVTDSCSEWGTKVGTASGTGLLTTITNAFGSGHKALIVAGSNADDTRNLCDNYVIKGNVGPIQGTIA